MSGKDTHQHGRVRAVRRWYEENYPDAAALVSTATAELPPAVIEIIEGEYRVLEEGEAPAGISAPAQSRGSGGGDNITQAQKEHILRLANSNNGWTEEDVVRHKLNGNPISSLSKSRASELIDYLKSQDSGGPRQGELGDT
ncbi:MAG: hypothetical protein IH921_05055 [Gemmatimonadetes bacterium]|nr:hypothetical protein [Gemmatimonadota bacterium]